MSATATLALAAGLLVYVGGVVVFLKALWDDLRDNPVLVPAMALLWPVIVVGIAVIELAVSRGDRRRGEGRK